jgi:hypothetical protein
MTPKAVRHGANRVLKEEEEATARANVYPQLLLRGFGGIAEVI